MNYNRITRFSKCDILIGYNDISTLGFDKTKTEGEMIDLAVLHKCPIIVRNGTNGKWYLKGKEKPIPALMEKINNNIGKSREGVFCLLLEE